MALNVKFQGREYVLVNGAIATVEAFEAGEASYAHLCPDGVIRRFNQPIGVEADLEIGGEYECQQSDQGIADSLLNVFTHPSWNE